MYNHRLLCTVSSNYTCTGVNGVLEDSNDPQHANSGLLS